jgi:putative ATPase
MGAARDLVSDGPAGGVPIHLRSTGYSGAGTLGHGDGYLYSHDHPNGVIAQQYFPDEVTAEPLFRPGHLGEEEEIVRRMVEIDRILQRKGRS